MLSPSYALLMPLLVSANFGHSHAPLQAQPPMLVAQAKADNAKKTPAAPTAADTAVVERKGPTAVPELSAEAAALVASIQRVYDKTTTFAADFEQAYQNRVFRRTERSRGKVAYQRPGKMRFDYSEPTPKTFLVDGKSLWVIQPKDNQALVDRCFKSDAMTSSLTFLFGGGKLLEQFHISVGNNAPERLVRLVLLPRKPQGAYQQLVLDVDPTSARMMASTVVDNQGNLNRFEFKNAVYDDKLGSDRFAYTPPKGITVMPIPGSCSK